MANKKYRYYENTVQEKGSSFKNENDRNKKVNNKNKKNKKQNKSKERGMALRNIVTIKSDIEKLRKKSKEVTEFNERLWTLLDDMKDTLHKADGLGLAAIQIGIMKRVAIIETDYVGLLEMVNPVITWHSEETEESVEGCLSIPGENHDVARPIAITLSAQDRFGKPYELKIEGFTARVVCHELDHLDGILYIDKVSKSK